MVSGEVLRATRPGHVGEAAFLGASLVIFAGFHWALARLGASELYLALLPNLLLIVFSLPWAARRSRVVGIGLGRRLGLVSGLLVIGLALLGLLAAFWRESAAGSAPLFSYLIGTLALGPIAEELYFRGAWLDFAARSFPKAAAAPLVSTAFGLLHVPQGGLVPMLILSLLLCAITLYTRSVLGAIGAHVLWNALVGLRLVPNNPGRWEVVLVASVAIGLAFALAWLLRRESDDCA